MKYKLIGKVGMALVGVLAQSVCGVGRVKAQSVPAQVGNLQSYEVARENVLQGTVVAYNPASTAPPFGAHVTLRTSSGVVDVHLGNGKLLGVNHLTLEPGEVVSITGENIAFGQGTAFAARIIQKGTQSVTLRSPHGLPLVAFSKGNAKQGGAL